LETVSYIWNGTGNADVYGDWIHSGEGVEVPAAMYRGTNGMSVIGVANNTEMVFTSNTLKYLDNFDFLSFWVNIRSWEIGRDFKIKLENSDGYQSDTLKMANYIDYFNTLDWQRVVIPLHIFNMNSEAIDTVRFILTKHLDFWMDELMLTLGSSIIIPVGKPDMETQDVGNKTMRTNINISPTPKVRTKMEELMLTLGPSIIPEDEPDMETQDVGNKTMRTNMNISPTPKVRTKVVDNFPGPINL
jgi:hypothetical protein